jgi:hypothetical protein
MTGNGQIGIMTTTPAYPLDVVGTIHSTSNVISKAGTLGPTIHIQWASADLPANGTFIYNLNKEPGNPGANGGSMFNGGFLLSTNDGSSESSWTRAKLHLRGCTLGTNTTASTYLVSLKCYNSNSGGYSLINQWSLTDSGSTGGYTTSVSPWFALTNTSYPSLGISFSNTVSSSNLFRLGPVYMDFS